MTTPAATRPVIGLVVDAGEGERLRPLVRHLARTVDLVAADRPGATSTPPSYAGVLVSGSAGLVDLPVDWSGPTALLQPIEDSNAFALVVGPAAAVRSNSEGDLITIAVPHTLASLPDWDPMPLMTRERWRTRLNWAPLVVVPPGHGRPLVPTGSTSLVAIDRPHDDALAVTLFGLASAAVVSTADLSTVVALATPCVSIDEIADPELATIVPHIIGSIDEAIAAATELATSQDAATTSARLLAYRHRHDAATPATALLGAFGFTPTHTSLGDLALRRCRDVGLAADSPLASRIADHFAPFAGSAESQEERS